MMIHTGWRSLTLLSLLAPMAFAAGCMCMGGVRGWGHSRSSGGAQHEMCSPMRHDSADEPKATEVKPSSRPANEHEGHKTGEATRHELR